MDMMEVRRRVMLASKRKRLPSEYQEVEWIQSNGGAYIDTGYVPTKNTSAKIEYEWTNKPSTVTLFGINTGPSLRCEIRYGTRWYCYANNVMWSYNSGGDITTIGGYTANTHYYLSLTGTTFTINNNSAEGIQAWNNTNLTALLFGGNTASGATQVPTSLLVFAFQLFEDGKLSLNFIPCYRKSDGEIGMYDTVSKTFYTNAGTGTFLKGADV